jgi:hypothetical protein
MFSPAFKEPEMLFESDIFTPLRELCHRSSNGVDVTLLWDPELDTAIVVVVDHQAGDAFEVEVGDANPMHVFHHPYVYRELELAA